MRLEIASQQAAEMHYLYIEIVFVSVAFSSCHLGLARFSASWISSCLVVVAAIAIAVSIAIAIATATATATAVVELHAGKV